jgi:hypothetical protein
MNARYFCVALATLVAAPLPVGAGVAPIAYHVVYHGKDLGMWDTLTIGSSKQGAYDGTSFDSSNGPGFLTLRLTRPETGDDRTKLFPSLPGGNDPLVVTQMRNGRPNGVTTCPKSFVSDFGIQGNPGKTTEAITFACTSVSTN